MSADISPELIVGGAAAFFAFLSVVVARLNYADGELERQNKLENRILDKTAVVEYEQEDLPPQMVQTAKSLGMASDPNDYGFDPTFWLSISDVLVTEKSGWRYTLSKLIYGFDGTTRILLASRRVQMTLSGGTISETPPDFSLVEGFDFEAYGMEYDLSEEDAKVIHQLETADGDRIEEEVNRLMGYVEDELGDIVMDWDA